MCQWCTLWHASSPQLLTMRNPVLSSPSALAIWAQVCMTLIASVLLRRWEKKLAGDDSYTLATTDQLAPTAGMLNHPGKGSNFDEHSKESELLSGQQNRGL